LFERCDGAVQEQVKTGFGPGVPDPVFYVGLVRKEELRARRPHDGQQPKDPK
jgi:hypothetical protein